jgi:uncharacterized membrane protein
MLKLLGISCAALLFANTTASAGLKFCNKTVKPFSVALGYFTIADRQWHSIGWYNINPGDCGDVLTGDLDDRYYYYYAFRQDGFVIKGNDEGLLPDELLHEFPQLRSQYDNTASFCYSRSKSFNANADDDCLSLGLKRARFAEMDVGNSKNIAMNLSAPGETLPEIKTGVVQERCLISWDDSFQVHSVDTVVEWNYQAVKTTMKKLRHCVKLTVTGPIDIGGVAQDYVNSCIDHALRDNAVIYALQGLIVLVTDIYATGGSASAANAAAYLDNVKTSAISCLTDTGKIQSYLKGVLAAKFSADVHDESHWEYWQV